MRYLLLLCLFAASFAEDKPLPPPDSYAPMLREAEQHVVTILAGVPAEPVAAPGNDTALLVQLVGEPKPVMNMIGSGIVITEDGYILTNNHVVAHSSVYKVVFQDGTTLDGTVVGVDPPTDLAIVKVQSKQKLSPIRLADSSRVEVGLVVFAIGNPFGIGKTVSHGIISAVGCANGFTDYEDFLQTDAALNPGNSGGALIDSNGLLVGVCSDIWSTDGANIGIGFAIPSNLAFAVGSQIIDHGQVLRGHAGIVIGKDLAIMDVAADGPAAKAGLAVGDKITTVNGQPFTDARYLSFMLGLLPPGAEVEFTVQRDGKSLTFKVVLSP